MTPKNTYIILLAAVLITYSGMLLGQSNPINESVYNVEIRFLRAFGTLGSDGPNNNPDPTWQMAVANDIDSIANRFDLLNNQPNVTNPDAYCWWTTTNNNGWHGNIDERIEILESNTTGFVEVEVMSYENDCIAQFDECIYHLGNVCVDDDDNMIFKNDLIDITSATAGIYRTVEVDLEPNFDFSKVELRYIWRHTHGTRDSPLNFGLMESFFTYDHFNSTAHENNDAVLKYANDWTASDNSNFTDALDVTYIFETDRERDILIRSNMDFDARVHIVELSDNNTLSNYISMHSDSIAMTLSEGTYGIIIEGVSSGLEFTTGDFNITLSNQSKKVLNDEINVFVLSLIHI